MLLNTKELIKSLKVAKKYVETKDLSQITSHIFFMQEDKETILKATNGEISISINLGIIENSFEFDVSLLNLLEFASGCIENDIRFQKVGANIYIESGFSSSKLEQYGVTEEDLCYCMDEELKKSSIAKVIDEEIEINESIFKSIAKNSSKFELKGMLLDLKNKKIVSTDTHRLSIQNISIDYKGLINEVIIPKAALQDVKTITDIKISKNYISFRDGNKKIISKQIIGKYPDYERTISKQYNFRVKVNGIELKNNLKKIKSKDITLLFENNKMKILTQNGNSTQIDCCYPSRHKFEISCNKIYIQDAILENKLELCFNDKNIPFTVNQNDGKQKTIIMPVIINNYPCDINLIREDFYKNNSDFIYKEVTKKRTPTVNKDKIIRELKKEVKELNKKLQHYENKNSIVKNEIFNNIFDNAKKVRA